MGTWSYWYVGTQFHATSLRVAVECRASQAYILDVQSREVVIESITPDWSWRARPVRTEMALVDH